MTIRIEERRETVEHTVLVLPADVYNQLNAILKDTLQSRYGITPTLVDLDMLTLVSKSYGIEFKVEKEQ